MIIILQTSSTALNLSGRKFRMLKPNEWNLRHHNLLNYRREFNGLRSRFRVSAREGLAIAAYH